MSALEVWVQAWSRWMAAMAWQAGVLILLVALADRFVLRRAWPGLRYGLWGLTALKLVLPPTLVSPVSVSAPAAARAAPLLDLGAMAQPGAPFPWATGLAAVWLAGVVVLATRAWIRTRRFHSAVLTGPVAPRPLRDELIRACRTLSLRRVPTLRISELVASPAVLGLRRPVVVLPETYADPTARHMREEIRHVLLHEVAHVRRGDLWCGALFGLLHLAYWFHPLVALARRRAHGAREVCCDLSVARALGESRAYRQTLLAHAARLLEQHPAQSTSAGTGFLFPRSTVLLRLDALERHGARPAGRARVGTALAALVVAAVVLPMAREEDAPVDTQPFDAPAAVTRALEEARGHLTDTLAGGGRHGCFAKRRAYYEVLRLSDELTQLAVRPE